MTAEEYVKHYASGQGGYESVPVDIALRAIEYAKREAKQQMMAKAKSGTVQKDNQVILDNVAYIDLDPSMQLKPSFVGLKEGDRIKVIVIKEE